MASDRAKRAVAAAVFCTVLIAQLVWIDLVLRPGPSSIIPWAAVDATRGEADVLVLGSSRTHCTVLPLEMWRARGITALNVTAGGQPLDVTAAFLRQALASQQPDVVILEVSMMGRSFEELPRAHANLDDMPIGIPKIEAIASSIAPGDWFEFVFPLQSYHSRWNGVGQYDFILTKHTSQAFARGGLYLREVEPQNGEVEIVQLDEQDYARGLEDVRAIVDECDSRDVRVILMTAPSFTRLAVGTDPVLHRLESDLRDQYPDVAYLDLNDATAALDVDPATDYKDRSHLNQRGAAKMSPWLADHLAREYGLGDRRAASFAGRWNDALREADERYPAGW